MASFITLLLLICVFVTGYLSLSSWLGLQNSIRQAKASGLPYVLLPFFPFGAPWMMLQPVLLPVIELLPSAWTAKWLPTLLTDRAWHNGYLPFERVGADTYIAASPGGCVLFTSDPQVNTQICRDGPFGKALGMMGLLNVFGPTLTASDGPEGRLYRKTAAPFFSEANMRRVWKASLIGAKSLTNALLQQDKAYKRLREILTKFTISLLNDLAFETSPDYDKELNFEEDVPQGHRLSYSEAMIQAADNIIAYFAVPAFALSFINPKASLAKQEMLQYVKEMSEKKLQELSNQSETRKTANITNRPPTLIDMIMRAHISSLNGDGDVYTTEAVSGNFFILNLAGFESSANAIAFMLFFLACKADVQEEVHQDLDRIFGDTPQDSWTYEEHFEPVFHGKIGAILHEIVRLYTVIPWIPRATLAGPSTVPLVIDGKMYELPPDMFCLTNTSATHRNPRYWPSRASAARESNSRRSRLQEVRPWPLSDFDYGRWQVVRDGVPSLRDPEPGSFMSFSDGPRACLGRRFAMIEMCAVVATIIKQHRVELMPEPGSTLEQVKAKAEWQLSGGIKFGQLLRATGDIAIRFCDRSV